MADVLWPSVVTALLSTAQTAVGANVPVFDGLPITYDDMRELVVIAGDAEGDEGAGGWDQRITTLGMPFRVEENGRVECSVLAQTGDSTASTTRVAAVALLEKIVDGIDADPTLGLADIVSGRVTSGRVATGQSSAGAYTEIQFTYSYEGTTGP